MPRRPVLASLLVLAPLSIFAAWPSESQGSAPNALDLRLADDGQQIEVELAREGATMTVSRTFSNPTPFPAQLEIPIPLDCRHVLDDLQVLERDATGEPSWRRAEVLTRDEASRRFASFVEGPGLGLEPATDADTAVLLRRSGSCDATLELHPLPPLGRRSVSYQVFVPSQYDQGAHHIELPDLVWSGRSTMRVHPPTHSGLETTVDKLPLREPSVKVAGDQGHRVVIRDRDAGHGHVEVADLQLEHAGPHQRLRTAEFAAPRVLAELPPVRRVVVLLDGSRSLTPRRRKQLQALAAGYLGALARELERSPAELGAGSGRARPRPPTVELLTFDREVHATYHGFAPLDWAREDLTKLEIEPRNGSEVGRAVDAARELFAGSPTPDEEGVDWILVLSDLDLRRTFELSDELSLPASVRVHVVSPGDAIDFSPAALDDPWAEFARSHGGMAWRLGTRGSQELFERELVRPTSLWNFGLVRELEDGSVEHRGLERRLLAASERRVHELDTEDRALARLGFRAEVWGQTRAWFAEPSEASAWRAAARLASDDFTRELGDETRAALARDAQVVSQWTSAWAVASFDGAAAAPGVHMGSAVGLGLHGYGGSYGCGGAHSYVHHSTLQTTRSLVEAAVAQCPRASGAAVVETTGPEVAQVETNQRCVARALWQIDLRGSDAGHEVIEFRYGSGRVQRYAERR